MTRISVEVFEERAARLVQDATGCDETQAARAVTALGLGGFLSRNVHAPKRLDPVCPPSAGCVVCRHRRGDCPEGSCEACDDAREARWQAMAEEAV